MVMSMEPLIFQTLDRRAHPRAQPPRRIRQRLRTRPGAPASATWYPKNTTGRRQANVGRFTGDPAHRRGRAGSICGGVAGVAPSQRLPARGFLPVRGPGPPSLPHARGRAPGQPAPGRIRSISCAKGKACAARLQCRPTGQGVRAGVAIHPDGKQASAGGRRATAAGASRSFPRRKKPGARWQRQGRGQSVGAKRGRLDPPARDSGAPVGAGALSGANLT